MRIIIFIGGIVIGFVIADYLSAYMARQNDIAKQWGIFKNDK